MDAFWQVNDTKINDVEIIKYLNPHVDVFYKQCKLSHMFGSMLQMRLREMFPGLSGSYTLVNIEYNPNCDLFEMSLSNVENKDDTLIFSINFGMPSFEYQVLTKEALAMNTMVLEPVDVTLLSDDHLPEYEVVSVMHLLK